MAQLRVGGPVPNRKQRPNPETITGRPMIGTFQGLGMPSTVKALQLAARAAGIKSAGSVARHAHKLDPRNLAHRCKPKTDYRNGQIRCAMHQAKRLSYDLDRMMNARQLVDMKRALRTRTKATPAVDLRLGVLQSPTAIEYTKAMFLLHTESPSTYHEVCRCEQARGQQWHRMVSMRAILPTLIKVAPSTTRIR